MQGPKNIGDYIQYTNPINYLRPWSQEQDQIIKKIFRLHFSSLVPKVLEYFLLCSYIANLHIRAQIFSSYVSIISTKKYFKTCCVNFWKSSLAHRTFWIRQRIGNHQFSHWKKHSKNVINKKLEFCTSLTFPHFNSHSYSFFTFDKQVVATTVQ